MNEAHALRIVVDEATTVSALAMTPEQASAAYVFAHGAGAGMAHAFMTGLAQRLAQADIATLRFQFPYMERGSRRPDVPAVAQAAVRAAVREAARHFAGLPLFAGGKSFGGRMTSQAQARTPLEHVRGLVFVGFPLHPEGKPGIERAAHLADVALPMLFVQGTRDELAQLDLLQSVVEPLRPRATLHTVDDADHSFHVRARQGRNDARVLDELAATIADWCVRHGAP